MNHEHAVACSSFSNKDPVLVKTISCFVLLMFSITKSSEVLLLVQNESQVRNLWVLSKWIVSYMCKNVSAWEQTMSICTPVDKTDICMPVLYIFTWYILYICIHVNAIFDVILIYICILYSSLLNASWYVLTYHDIMTYIHIHGQHWCSRCVHTMG